MSQDPDIAKYQAALKRSSFKVPRGAIVTALGIALMAGGAGLAAWRHDVEKEEAAAEQARRDKEDQERWAREREAEASRRAPLDAVVNEYANVDPATLPEGPIELARGRRVLGVHTLWLIEDAEVRRVLHMPDAGEKRRALFLPGGFEKSEGAASLALKPEDVGTVVLVRSASAPIGTYEDKSGSASPPGGGKKPELKGYETLYSFVAFVVPERKVVARWTRRVLPPLTVRTTRDGMPLELTFGDLEAADYKAYADALFAGRAPGEPAPSSSGAPR